MAVTQQLPYPILRARLFGARCLTLLTDDELWNQIGVRIAFTTRNGGVSAAPYESLNLGTHVGDDPVSVDQNRASVLEAIGAPAERVVVPDQVHGSELVEINSSAPAAFEYAQERACAGADGLIVTCSGVSALLCFADCVPVIIVAPDGHFAVVHAGWRGVMAHIAPKALLQLLQTSDNPHDSRYLRACNIYIGPHICASCFETSEELAHQFADTFTLSCTPDDRHVNLTEALRISLIEAGADPARIVDAGLCTKEHVDAFYSYRAEDGVCGRHGAIAYKKES